MTITGISSYQNIGVGFWGIIAEDGNSYLPLNMPEQLKREGAQVRCRARISNVETMHMWGTPINIISFETIGS